MKKVFLSLLLIASFLAGYSQSATLMKTVFGDTVTKVINATAGYSALGIQVNAVKVSGTITAKAYLYSSLDGVTYNLTDSATAFANSAGAQSVWFTKTTTPYTFYKVQVRTVGT